MGLNIPEKKKDVKSYVICSMPVATYQFKPLSCRVKTIDDKYLLFLFVIRRKDFQTFTKIKRGKFRQDFALGS